jgi:hypothetical protein
LPSHWIVPNRAAARIWAFLKVSANCWLGRATNSGAVTIISAVAPLSSLLASETAAARRALAKASATSDSPE